jgi:3-oxoacyl-(acyl-carrier-protein) synthase
MSRSRSDWRRVVITGLGTVNPLGLGVAASWEARCAGWSGIGPIEQFDVSAFPVRFAGESSPFRASSAFLGNHGFPTWRSAQRMMDSAMRTAWR